MKKLALCLLVIVVTFLTPATTHAGFVVRKHTAVQSTKAVAVTKESTKQTAITEAQTQLADAIQLLQSPSGTFVGMMYRGTIGLLAFVCGLLGFWAPFFAVGAMLLGFLGIIRRQMRNKGFAIAGLVLGLIAILASSLGGFAPLPIF